MGVFLCFTGDKNSPQGLKHRLAMGSGPIKYANMMAVSKGETKGDLASKAFHYDVHDHLGLVAGSSSGPSRLWCRI